MKRLADCPTPLWLMPPVFVVAVALNYLWELGQGSFYEGVTDDLWAWWHCFVASLGDGALVCAGTAATGLRPKTRGRS